MSYTLAARQCFVCAAQAMLIALDIREATTQGTVKKNAKMQHIMKNIFEKLQGPHRS